MSPRSLLPSFGSICAVVREKNPNFFKWVLWKQIGCQGGHHLSKLETTCHSNHFCKVWAQFVQRFMRRKSKMCFFNMVARETNLLLGRPSFEQTRNCMSLQSFVQSLDSIHPQFLEKKSKKIFF